MPDLRIAYFFRLRLHYYNSCLGMIKCLHEGKEQYKEQTFNSEIKLQLPRRPNEWFWNDIWIHYTHHSCMSAIE